MGRLRRPLGRPVLGFLLISSLPSPLTEITQQQGGPWEGSVGAWMGFFYQVTETEEKQGFARESWAWAILWRPSLQGRGGVCGGERQMDCPH